jgi:two-component system, sensor histidine kinase and response regulator
MTDLAAPTRANTSRLRVGLVAFALLVVLSVIAFGIADTHAQTKHQILANFKARGKTSAGFVSTYLSQQETREIQSAEHFLSGRTGLTAEFGRVASVFGSNTAGLFDSSGRVLAILPRDPALVGVHVASRYAHLSAAEAGRAAVSGVVPSAARHEPVIAVAVPYATREGRRVFSPAYPVAGSVLATFVAHSVSTKGHLVLLIDARGNTIAASPRTATTTLLQRSPALNKAVARSSHGGVTVDGRPSTFIVTPVAGAPWRVVIAVPNAKLFASISGWALWLPWIVFAMIAILALVVLSLFSRSLVARARLEVLSAEAQEASRLKSEFVASMSHEIRTPLNGIIGMTELLRDTSVDSVQIEYLDALGASGEALLGVISDVLDFSKIEAGFLELDRTDFELRDAVEEACQMLAEQAHSKGLEINHWVDGDVPLTVNGDRARLRQILLNLLSNAVKFTATGEVTVRVSSDDHDRISFSISDTGVGIDDEQASALFEAFAQADQSTTRQYGGTGLGLAISSQLVELMGGEIGARPGEASGSVFWFSAELPEVEGTAEPVRSPRDLRGLRTLVVDDNASNRTILEHYLRDWGIACESVDRPSAAISALERASREGNPFELALLDFNMPQMNGMELLREIRSRPALDALKTVILSSGSFESAKFEGMRVSAVLKKPASQTAIYDAIAAAFAGTAPSAEEARAEPAAETHSSNRGQLVLVAEDNEINRTVIQALLGKLGLQTAVAHNGREAIEMAAGHAYDAIFMDCLMPDTDGFQATREIRSGENGRRVPIIAMTALSMPGDPERCLAAGMDDYLSKPIRTAALDEAVERWLPAGAHAQNGASSGNGAPPAANGGSAPAEAVLDQATIQQLRETLTPEMRTELLDTFDEQQVQCVADIAAAVKRDDRDEVRRVAHLLKGSAASLGAMRLRHCSERLEHVGRSQDAVVSDAQVAQLRDTANEASRALRQQLIA